MSFKSNKFENNQKKLKEFTTKPNTDWDKGVESECCGPVSTGAKIVDGPLCGVEVFMLDGECVVFNPDTKQFEPTSDDIKNCIAADVEECCTEALPERYCLNLSGVSGNGNPASTYNLNVGGDLIPLSPDYTALDVFNLIDTGDMDFNPTTGQVCSLSPFGVIIQGQTAAGEPPDIVFTLFRIARPALLFPAVEAECVKYGRTYGKREDEIADAIACLKDDIKNISVVAQNGINTETCVEYDGPDGRLQGTLYQTCIDSEIVKELFLDAVGTPITKPDPLYPCETEDYSVLVEKLCAILGDPDLPCPDCPEVPAMICDNEGLITYAQPEFTVTGVTLGGNDISGKFNLPIDGNIAPVLSAFKDTLVACLEDAGYTVNEIQGRDGWSLSWNGEQVEVQTTGDGQIGFASTNCI